MKQVGLFLDLENLYFGSYNKFKGRKIDFGYLLMHCLNDNEGLYRGIAFGTQNPKNINLLRFLNCLQSYNIDYVYCTNNTRIVNLVLDVVKLLPKLDVIVVGSASVSIIPLIKFVRDRGVEVRLIGSNIGSDLKNEVNYWTEINEDWLEC